MTREEQALLLKIADSVGKLFEKLEKNPLNSEITFDQETCAELWDDYEEWAEFNDDRRQTRS